MRQSVSCTLLCLLLWSSIHANVISMKKNTVIRDNNLGKRVELSCKEEETGCDLICLPLRCRNIHFMAAKQVETSIRCGEDLSCIGELQIEGRLSSKGLLNLLAEAEKKSLLIIECLSLHACHGGTYAFANALNAKFIGHAKESSIVFNNIDSVEMSLDAEFIENADIVEQFAMNHVYTDNVKTMQITANAHHSMVGSVFHLGGLFVAKAGEHRKVGTVNIECLKPGACDGSIFLLKQCGGDINVACALHACQFVSFVFRPTRDCWEEFGQYQRVFNLVINDEAKEYQPDIFIWVEPQRHNKIVNRDMVQITFGYDKQYMKGENLPNWIIKYETGEQFRAALRKREEALQKKWDKIKENVGDNKKWILEEANVEYHGGIYAECAWTMVDYAQENVAWILGPLAASAALGAQLSISMAILGGFFPVTIAGVVAATIWGVRQRAENKHNAKFGKSDSGVSLRDVDLNEKAALNEMGRREMQTHVAVENYKSHKANEEMENMYGEFMDEFFDFNGDIVEYDFFSGERLVNDDDDNEHGFLIHSDDAYENEGYYVSFGQPPMDHESNGYLLILCSFVLMICCFCSAVMCLLGGIFGWMCRKGKYELSMSNDDFDCI